MKNKNSIIMGIVTIVLVIGAFFTGKSYGKSHTATLAINGAAGQYGRAGMGGNFGGRAGGAGGATIGQVVSKDANSITVSIPNGGSKIILYSPSTSVMKSVQGAVSDVVIGSNITAMGTTNSDGSITATAIQIRPIGTTKPASTQQ